jgi:hypothetical protein
MKNDERKTPARRGRWQPGESGNPAGRPPLTRTAKELKEACKALTPKTLGVLDRIASNPKSPAAARVKASEVLLSYAWGRPAQTIGLDEGTQVPS